MEIVDISKPTQPILLNRERKIFNRRGHFDFSSDPGDLFFSDDESKLYLAGNSVGLVVFDISHNNLQVIQKTGKYNPLILFPETGDGSLLSIDSYNKNTLILASTGNSGNNTIKVSTSIKGVKSAIILDGDRVLVSKKHRFIVLLTSVAHVCYGKPEAVINIIKIKFE